MIATLIIPLRPNTTSYTVISALWQSFSAARPYLTLYGLTVDHNSHPRHFQTFLTAGVFYTNFPHQDNGKVEATVKSLKKLLQHSWNGRALDDEKLCWSLLQYRNTPSRKDGLSPAQKLFGHPVQDIVPAHQRSFLPQWQQTTQEAAQQAEDTSKLSAAYYNIHAHNLPDIHVGSHVAVKNPQS